MDNYERYEKISENLESLNFEDSAVMHFRNMYERLILIKEKENVGELSDEEKTEKTTLMADLDSFIESYIQRKKEQVENKIEEFRKYVEKTSNKIENIKVGLVLGDGLYAEIPQMIKEVESDLEELINQAKELISEVDEFKNTVSGYTDVELTTNYNEIQSTLTNLKDKLKEIKQTQIDKYNARVEGVNKEINELKNLTPEELDKLPEEVRAMIADLQTISSCDVVVSSYKNIKYMSELDYNKLVQTMLAINSIKSAMGKEQEPTFEAELDAEIEWIEHRIQEINDKIKDGLTKEEIEELQNEIANVAQRTVEFEVKINNLKEQLNEKYEEYFGRVNDAQANLAELNARLNDLGKTIDDVTDDYKYYVEKLNLLEGEVNSFSSLVEALFGKVLVDAVSALDDRFNTLNGRLEEIEKDVEKAYEEKKLDQNQYEQLKQQIERVKNTLEGTKEKLRNPEMAKDVDIFSFLNGTIDGIEKAIEALETRVDALEKPIKDRSVRKEIDAIFKSIEKEIKDVEKMLEKYKDKDPEKYEAAKERLDGLKGRLDKVGKNYRKKCPLLIRAFKSAKAFYKKHKKMCLIIAGLAAIALIHATVGPILIPAIMQGNIMIGFSSPALRGFTNFVNNILGGMIGATQVNGIWSLASGAVINPAVASTSLLKGLAISGLGSAALLAPLTAGVVIAVKKIMAKMKNAERKSIKEKFTGVKEKVKSGKEKISEKISKLKNKKGKIDKETLDDLKELIADFEKSGKTFGEYCEENELSDSDRMFLEAYITKMQEEFDKEQTKGRKGGRK